MKKKGLSIVIALIFTIGLNAQEWMQSLDIAQRLALVQNKMILMVWEDTAMKPYPIFMYNEKRQRVLIPNLFNSEEANELIWQYFVPVIVSENQYSDLYQKIKEKRSIGYIDTFNDDSIKIMDANGNILNRSYNIYNIQNINEIIKMYALNTQFISQELRNYKNKKTFYSTFYLASKYLDFSMFHNAYQRKHIIRLFDIYIDEASEMLKTGNLKEKPAVVQRLNLVKLQKFLILKRPKKVLRQLHKMKADSIKNNNKQLIAFLYFTAHKLLKNENEAKAWESKISSVNLRKSEIIVNINS